MLLKTMVGYIGKQSSVRQWEALSRSGTFSELALHLYHLLLPSGSCDASIALLFVTIRFM